VSRRPRQFSFGDGFSSVIPFLPKEKNVGSGAGEEGWRNDPPLFCLATLVCPTCACRGGRVKGKVREDGSSLVDD